MSVRWLVRFTLFKLMFMSGVVKIQANCPSWLKLTALDYHYATQCTAFFLPFFLPVYQAGCALSTCMNSIRSSCAHFVLSPKPTGMLCSEPNAGIPTPLAWYAHQLPPLFQQASVAACLMIEIPLALLILAPFRSVRVFAGVCQSITYYKSNGCTIWIRDVFCYRTPAPLVLGAKHVSNPA